MGRLIHNCRLCTKSYQEYASEFREKPILIFLSIEAVLIREDSSSINAQIRGTWERLFTEKKDLGEEPTLKDWHIAAAYHFSSDALMHLYTLISKLEASKRRFHIVLSSNWRHDGTLNEICNQVLPQHLFAEYIIGKLPPSTYEYWAPEIQAGERYDIEHPFSYMAKIEFWLREHFLEDADFIVLKSRHTMPFDHHYAERFIKIDSSLLSKKHIDEAFRVLCLQV